MGIPDHLTRLLRNLYAGQEATVRTGHGTTDWFQIYIKAVYCHPAYLTYMQSTSCKMLGWMKHKLELRLLGEISIRSDMQIIPLLQQKDFPGGADGKASAYNAGDPGSIPGLGRSPGEGNGTPLQYSCLENPMDGGAYSPWGPKESMGSQRVRHN